MPELYIATDQHHARAFRFHGCTYYAACECGWRTRTHLDEVQAQRDAFLHNEREARKP